MTKKPEPLRATHAGILPLGNLEFPCAVLENRTRVITGNSFMKAMGMYRSGALSKRRKDSPESAQMPLFLAYKNLKPFIDKDLSDVLLNPIEYFPPKRKRGRPVQGINAEAIPKICEVWLKARDAEVLGATQLKIAAKADIVIRALAHVGIIALVDEVTGYQEIRDRDELHKILEAYIAKELLPWTRRFPDEFYRQLFKLRNWQYSPLSVKRPQYVGKLTNQLVYEKLPPGVLNELRKKNPVTPKGFRKHRHHQFLTENIGNPHLERHIASVTTLMRAASNWRNFERLFQRAFPSGPEQLELEFMGESEN